MGSKESNVAKSFSSDPTVQEIIKSFMYVDRNWIKFMSLVCDPAEVTKINYTLKQLLWFAENEHVSKLFKVVVFREHERLAKKLNSGKLPHTRKAFNQAVKWMKQIDPHAVTTNLAFYIVGNFGMEMIIPDGKRNNWLLNCMILTLVEYGKKKYPNARWYSDLAKKFNATTFKMTGWSRSDRARKIIEDRYSWMKNRIDRRKISDEILDIFTLSE